MSIPKGQIHTPNAVTERVLAIVATLPHGEFSVRDIQACDSELRGYQISSVLRKKSRQHAVERVGYDRYRIGGIRIKTTLPRGLVTDAVWAVLSTDDKRLFKRRAEIVGETESYLGRPGYRAYGPVNYILTVWHRDGHLERAGEPGEYGYRLREGITERPACNYRTS